MWIHLRKERFLNKHFSKLHPRADGPFCFLKKINDNAYKIELPGDYNVPTSINVADLSTFVGDFDDEADSRLSPFQYGRMMHVVKVLMHGLMMPSLIGMEVS